MFTETQSSNQRPVWVWIITIYTLFGVAMALMAPLFRWLVWRHPIRGAQEVAMPPYTTLEWVFWLIIPIVALTAAISLFMLRKRAVTFFVIRLVISVVVLLYQAVHLPSSIVRLWSSMPLLAILPAIMLACFGLAINIAVIVYTRHLVRRGVLT